MGTKKYLVKLTPHQNFFFGGERTFGQKTDEKDTTETNYFVLSNYYPQQTAVLGFVRHQLLLQADNTIFDENHIKDESKAIKLIGDGSFRINRNFPYGKIHSISPVFLCKASGDEQDYYFAANKEFQKYTKMNDECEEEDVDKFLELGKANGVFLLNGYDPKFDFDDFLVNKKLERLKYDEVFKEQRQVGIRKKYKGGTDDDAYYIQTFFRFETNDKEPRSLWSFAFILELDETINLTDRAIVPFGGEQQAFKMEVQPDFNTPIEKLIPEYQPSKNFDKVVLVSDAFVESNEILQVAEYAITQTLDFRFLSTNTLQGFNYYNRPNKSSKYNLFKRGSVFYGDVESIEKQLKNKEFQNLGYNIYKRIKKN